MFPIAKAMWVLPCLLYTSMKDGDIVEQGTHEELMAKGGFYANLYNSQFETGEEEAG